MDPLLTISFKSFSSVWFWIMLGVSWSLMCHWTLGVPYDALVRADQKGGDQARQAEELAHLNIARTTHTFRSGGAIITALVCFVLAVIATFGFAYNYELARAFFVYLAPLALVIVLNVRLAFRLEREGIVGAAMLSALVKRRFWNQVIGLSSVVMAVIAAFFTFASQEVLWYW